jgi:hypothetical protein
MSRALFPTKRLDLFIHPLVFLASSLVGHVARNDFRQYMGIAMERLKTEAEK